MSRTDREIPVITDDDINSVAAAGGRGWTPDPDRYPRRCGSCGEEAVVFRDDLEWREVRGGLLLVLRRLSGEHCTNCGETWFDPESFTVIDEARGGRVQADYEASVGRVGGRSLGMYFPKDLQRVMGLEAGQKAYLTPVSEDVILVEIRRPKEGSVEGNGGETAEPSGS